MLQLLLSRFVAKHGLIPLLLKVGDIAVKVTKSKKDDANWVKIKKQLKKLNA